MNCYICNTDNDNYYELVEEYPKLLKDKYKLRGKETYNCFCTKEENLNAVQITLESMEDLKELVKDIDCHIVFEIDDNGDNVIEIYDNYRE